MKIMFLDESGDHNLSIIDSQYPIFVLGGVIVEKEYAETVMAEEIRKFKRDLFGHENIILHTADITRNRNGFEKVKDPSFRKEFYQRLNELMKSLQYKVVACVIKKDSHFSKYGLAALDPYMLSLHILVERFYFEVGAQGSPGIIMTEKRDPTLDHELELAWLNLKIQGTKFLQAKKIEGRIQALVARKKNEKIAGLELADLVVSPIGRHILGKTDKEDYRIIESKFRRDYKGEHEGAGLIVLPK